jgi:DNA ligase (NAD+)
VSGNTNFLINNDVTSNSSKNKKAKELGIEIISEETFIDRFTK